MVLSAQFSPDGMRVVTASYDKTARIWDARTGLPLTEPLRHKDVVYSAKFSPDGSRVVTASFDKTARVWDARTGRPLTDPLRHGKGLYYAEFSPDGSRVVTASVDKTARVWDARTGQPMGKPLLHENAVHSAQFSPDGLRIVTASYDNTARVWDARTGQPLMEPLRHEGAVIFVQFSPDGSRIVTASFDHTARVWDARTGQPVGEPLQHDGALYFAQFSPDGSRVVTASSDNTARVWDARTGRPLGEPMLHDGSVRYAEFSPDGLRIVTASYDKTARVWEAFPTPAPVPSWFLDWTEARVGRRFAAAGQGVVVPFGEQRRQWELAQSRMDTNFFTRIAQWVQEDPATRPISPNATLTTPEYVRRRIEENTLPSLREALLLSPSDSLAWARMALRLTKADADQNDTNFVEAEWSSQHALKLDPNQAEAWRAGATIQWLRNRPAEALTNLDRALALRPEDRESWELKGDILEHEERHAEALEAYNRWIALLPVSTEASGSARLQALVKHAAVCRNLQRWNEAAADLRLLGVPAREPGADARLIDLSAFYNASLRGNWCGDQTEDDLAALPTGIQLLAGTKFDIRGVVQLGGRKFEAGRFPDQVAGIPLAAKAARIHFLQAVVWGNEDPPGMTIGKYVLHYADGSVLDRPLVLGRDVLDWHAASSPGSAGDPTAAWTSENTNSVAEQRPMRLYDTMWVNPRPEAEIARLDFVSAGRAAAPFLVAVTIER
jgi:tetratricopeptide (TPR) repeat protein